MINNSQENLKSDIVTEKSSNSNSQKKNQKRL